MHIEVNPRWVHRPSGAFVNHGDDPRKPKDEPALETVRDGVHITLDASAALAVAALVSGRYDAVDVRAVGGLAKSILEAVRVTPTSALREQWRLRGESGEEHAP